MSAVRKSRRAVVMSQLSGLLLLSISASAANLTVGILSEKFQTGLFLDTIFTITAVFSGGLEAGLLTAFFTTAGSGWTYYALYGQARPLWVNLYGLCSAAAAIITWFFARSFPDECASLRLDGKRSAPKKPALSFPQSSRLLDRIVMLCFLSLTQWIVISVMGGLIACCGALVFQNIPEETSIENTLKMGLLQRGFGLAFAEIIARIPINIIDRPLSALVGYGASLLLKKRRERPKRN